MKKITILLTILFSLLVATRAPNLGASSAAVINGPNLIQKEKRSVLTLSDILNFYTSDLGGVSVVEDNYTGNGATLGIYTLELSSSSGSEQIFKEIKIQVLSEIGYSVRAVTDKRDIHIAKTNKLNPVEIVRIHANTGVFPLNQTSELYILTDDYSSKAEIPGRYLFEYRIVDASGLDITVSAYLTVYESDRIQGPVITVPAKPNPILKIFNTLTTILFVGIIAFVGLKLYKVGRSKK